VLQRPLGETFSAAAGEALWFSFLFRSNNVSPLANRDYFQVGLDDNAQASNGTPRVGIGITTTGTGFAPSEPFRFFAKSTIDDASTAFSDTGYPAIATYLLVGRVAASGAAYDTVELFVNPSLIATPGPAAATASVDSGLASLSHLFLRTSSLDNTDVYVIDELKIGRTYESVVAPPPFELFFNPGGPGTLHWSALLEGAILQTSDSLGAGSWSSIPGPFGLQGTEFFHPLLGPAASRGYFRLWHP